MSLSPELQAKLEEAMEQLQGPRDVKRIQVTPHGLVGRQMPQTTKEKQRAAHIGKLATDETRERQRQAQIARCQAVYLIQEQNPGLSFHDAQRIYMANKKNK